MINFSDEWTVGQIAKSRQTAFLNEARQHRVMREVRSNRRPTNGVRHSMGETMIRLGEQIMGIGVLK